MYVDYNKMTRIFTLTVQGSSVNIWDFPERSMKQVAEFLYDWSPVRGLGRKRIAMHLGDLTLIKEYKEDGTYLKVIERVSDLTEIGLEEKIDDEFKQQCRAIINDVDNSKWEQSQDKMIYTSLRDDVEDLSDFTSGDLRIRAKVVDKDLIVIYVSVRDVFSSWAIDMSGEKTIIYGDQYSSTVIEKPYPDMLNTWFDPFSVRVSKFGVEVFRKGQGSVFHVRVGNGGLNIGPVEYSFSTTTRTAEGTYPVVSEDKSCFTICSVIATTIAFIIDKVNSGDIDGSNIRAFKFLKNTGEPATPKSLISAFESLACVGKLTGEE